MKHGTAVRHLAEIAGSASEYLAWRDGPFGMSLRSLWAAGAVLGTGDSTEVLLMLDVPADELPWLAPHPEGDRVADVLRLGKRPLLWSCRPATGPAWNARHRRVVRFWSDEHGADDDALEALRHRSPSVVEPSSEEWRAQLREEHVLAHRHLRTVLDRYHEPSWRREHKGFGRYPDDHLWCAAESVREIEDALAS